MEINAKIVKVAKKRLFFISEMLISPKNKKKRN